MKKIGELLPQIFGRVKKIGKKRKVGESSSVISDHHSIRKFEIDFLNCSQMFSKQLRNLNKSPIIYQWLRLMYEKESEIDLNKTCVDLSR